MGIVIRQSIKTSIITFAGAFVGAITNFVYIYAFTKGELGFFTTLIYLAAILQLFALMGFGSTLFAFTTRYHEGDVRRKVLITLTLLVTVVTSLLIGLGFVLLQHQIVGSYKPQDQPIITRYYYYIPLLVSIWSLMTVFEHYLLSQIKIAASAFVKEVILRIFNLALLVLYFYHLVSFDHFIILSVLAYIIPVILLYIISSKTNSFGFSLNFKAFSKTEYKELFGYAWYHLLFSMSGVLLGYMDTLMVGQLDEQGLQSAAPYRIATFIITIIIIPYKAISSSAFAVLNKAYVDDDKEKLSDLFHRSGINILIVTLGMMAIIFCNLDNLIGLLKPEYAAIKPIVIILMIGRLVDMGTGMNNELISVSKYYKFNFRVSALLVVLIYLSNRALIPIYGIYGAAWGVTLSLAVFNILKLWFLWVKMHLHPFSKNNIIVLVCGAATIAGGYYLPFIGNIYIDTLIRTFAVIAIYALLLLWLKPSKDLSSYLISIKTNRKLF